MTRSKWWTTNPVGLKKDVEIHPFVIFISMKKFKITEKQLKYLKESLVENNEQSNPDGNDMLKQQLYTISVLTKKMWEHVEDGENIDDWMTSKIAQCESSIISVVKAYFYDEIKDDGIDGMKILNPDDIVIGQ